MFHQVNFDEKDDSSRENNSVPNGPIQNVFFFFNLMKQTFSIKLNSDQVKLFLCFISPDTTWIFSGTIKVKTQKARSPKLSQ